MRVSAATVREPAAVKLVTALIFREEACFDNALTALAKTFSKPDYIGPAHPFDLTHYYEPEMGPGLKRVFVSYHDPIEPTSLVAIKWRTHGMEADFSEDGRRRVNIDPGYLDLFKLVLASFKGRGHKVYLGRGVWADTTAYFDGGRFESFQWSFPDFQNGRYNDDLLAIRQRLKLQRRALAAAAAEVGSP